ncbi:MAG TPA: YihY/virulence factor BrkB family protein [Verrucomicrobiae bacterium]|jgi:membrane protein|nr:YihY/virulence factor BrkB family protein [Verrucomicrobiae bacterium]
MKGGHTSIETCWKFGGLHCGELALRVIKQFKVDRVAAQSAQVSYYFFFAIFPLLLSLTALLGLFAEPGTFLHQAITHYFGAVLPAGASKMIESELGEISKHSTAGKLSLGLFVAVWSASSGMSAIIDSINLSYCCKTRRPWWREKLLAICLTAVVSVLLILAMALVMYGGQLAHTLASHFGLGHPFAVFWTYAQWPILLASLTVAFSLIYYFAPNIKHSHWNWLMPGTVIGVVLWVAVSLGFRLYLRFFNNYSVTYGSIGTIIILLLWFYLSGVALLVGGEVNSAIERALGKGDGFA